jgi:hypothetical protein
MTMTVNETVTVNGVQPPKDTQGRPHLPDIPRGAASFEVIGTQAFPDSATLYALWPHMHYRGKDMTFVLKRSNGHEETLLSVPKYDPHWQVTYELVKPVKVPARSTIVAIAHYDNSAANRNNPAPGKDVMWGPQASNEMFLPFLEVSIDKDDLRFEGLDPLR